MMQMIGATQNIDGNVEKYLNLNCGSSKVISYHSILCLTAYGRPATSRYTPHICSKSFLTLSTSLASSRRRRWDGGNKEILRGRSRASDHHNLLYHFIYCILD